MYVYQIEVLVLKIDQMLRKQQLWTSIRKHFASRSQNIVLKYESNI